MEGGEFGRGEFEILARAVEMQRSLLSQHVVGDALENVRDSVDSLWGLLQHIDAALTEVRLCSPPARPPARPLTFTAPTV